MENPSPWFCRSLLLFISAVQGDDNVLTNVYPKYDVSPIDPYRYFTGVWKLEVNSETVLKLKAWTETEEKMVETGCTSWTLYFRMHRGSPSLPTELRIGATEYISPQEKAWLNDTIEMSPIAIGQNDTNEMTYEVSFAQNSVGDQYLTSWLEEAPEHPTMKQKIENKLGVSTRCRPKIQFNLTQIIESSENDVPIVPEETEQNTTGFNPLSKNNVKTHTTLFYNNDTEAEISLDCIGLDGRKNKFYFEVDGVRDIGGTLDFRVFNSTTQMCMSQTRPEDHFCENEIKLYHNQSFYMPQPSPGIWYIELTPLNCSSSPVSLNFTLSGCVNNCGQNDGRGECRTAYVNNGVLMSSCECKAGFKGIACSDSENAMTSEYQLLELLLLTLSNLFFLPAIMISIHRRYWQEAIVFTIAMACSTVYHACDQRSTQKFYCLAQYDTLQFSDFLAATTAMWVTVLAVADLPQKWTNVLQNTGVFMFAIGAHYDRYSAWLFAAPIIVGMCILGVHWIYQCRVRRDCYPPKGAWFCHIIPGLLFAAGGFLTKIIFEFEGMDGNYYWTHTLWHAFLGLSCAFLLPDITYDATKMYNPDSNNLISYYKSFDEPNFEPNEL